MKASNLLSDERLRKLVLENVSDIIITTDFDFRVLSWNHMAEKYYGITAGDAVGRHMREIVPFIYHHTSREAVREQVLTTGFWQGEVSLTTPGNEIAYFLFTLKVVTGDCGRAAGVLAVGQNITRYKAVEVQLAQSERFYRALIADSLDVVLLLKEDGLITFTSPSVQTLLGYGADEILGHNAFAFVHPDDRELAVQSFEREVEENPEIKFIIVRLRKKDGNWLWCMVRGHNLLNVPELRSIVVYIHDDTPRKLAQESLRQSEKQFRTLIRDLHVGVLLQAANGEILMTNNAMARMFELAEEAMLGNKIWDLCDDVIHEDGSVFLLNERPAYRAIVTKNVVRDVVVGVWNRGRKERTWIMVNADPIFDAEGKLSNVVCTYTDITERKKREKKSFAEKMAYQRYLAQATIDGQEKERLEMGRELHDNIGQQLTSIKLFLDLAKASANPQTVGMIDMSLKAVSNVINEVRYMSRSLVPPTLKDLGFIDSVNDLVDSLRMTQAISFEVDYFNFDEDLLPENQKLALFRIIQEQLNNILKYAQAGTVHIGLHFVQAQVLLEIRDDGRGFDLGKIRRGMGLTNIINRSELFGGKVEIITSPGNGCSVKVWLPHTAISPVFE